MLHRADQSNVRTHAHTTLHNVGWLIVQRGLHVVAGAAFAIVIPRMMGPETFGRYALMTSIAVWFTLLSGLDAVPVMSRFVPQFLVRGDRAGLQKLVSNLLILRLTNGVLAATLYFLLTALWLRELDWVVLALVAGSVFVRTGANLFFALFLGLNQAARWGLGEFLRRWFSLGFLLLGLHLGGLRGACLGLVLTELVVLSVGLWWGRAYLAHAELRLDRRYLAPFLRFGASFFASNLLLVFCQHSGEALVRLICGDYVQVGYYGLAYNVYLMAAYGVWQVVVAFAPLLTVLLERGETEALQRWIERLLKWLAIGGVLAVFSVLLLGDDLVPLVLGTDYRPVAAHLAPLTLALLPLALGSMGRLLALIYDRPGVALRAAVIQLVTFWTVGPPLVARGGSLAACVTVLIASTLYAGYYTWRTRADLHYSPRAWAWAILLSGLFVPLIWLRSLWSVNIALYGAFVVGYSGLLLLLRLVTLDEFAVLRKALRPSGA